MWVKAGTQHIDNVWKLLKSSGVPKNLACNDDLVENYTREFQWIFWNGERDKRRAMGGVFSSVA